MVVEIILRELKAVMSVQGFCLGGPVAARISSWPSVFVRCSFFFLTQVKLSEKKSC